ncbi:hypothetical protein BDP81DRAFT_71934 [Colletotrichum phormii]|uniref:Uncharacterized protein n=1 Tax=Colletotrichum phormii TaxID=359342 RepID=A0AAI9ZJS5_9PEZI|nr:uncharacterized protein BDP81DRAFT_71934 [Colletotrichum phormii]KAK1633290.1 hypothetical protein BDP81DRAFT_71934 [Colletotrichum phormii]
MIEIDSLLTHSSAKNPRRCNVRYGYRSGHSALRCLQTLVQSLGLAHRWFVPLKDVTGDNGNPPRVPICVPGDLSGNPESLMARPGLRTGHWTCIGRSVTLYRTNADTKDGRRDDDPAVSRLPSRLEPCGVPRRSARNFKQALEYLGLGG